MSKLSRTDLPALSRRALIRSALGTSLAAGFSNRAAAASPPSPAPQSSPPRARACILLYMAGGPSHLDTFDLKPGSPGGGTFRAVETAAKGIRISEHLPRLGRSMKQMALIRSLTSKEGNHDRARHLMHTGYAPAGGVNHPAFGALISEARDAAAVNHAGHAGRTGHTLPGYVAIGGPGKDAGFLSAAHAPFPINNPQRPVRYLGRAKGIDDERWQRRLDLWRGLEDRFGQERGGAFAKSRREIGEKAISLMSGGVDAFDLASEPDAIRARYGDTGFGAGCLMARRLVQAGVPFVEVTLNGWDTHDNNFDRVKALSATLDQGMSELLTDMRASGLLSSTLVVWMGDFGRSPRINEKGGRDHHPGASSVLLAGAGIAGGQVIGATDDEGREVCEQPVTVADLYRTIALLSGLDPDRMRMSPAGRPIKTVDVGKPIKGLIS